jgi:hypothetical protein
MKQKGVEHMIAIYKYTNKINNKIYIGQTMLSPEERSRNNGKGYKKSPLFYNAIEKYGFNNFSFQILTEAKNQNLADILEKKYIKKYKSNNLNNGYNMTYGGKGYRTKGIKNVIGIDINFNVIEFTSAEEAARSMGLFNGTSIIRSCKKQKHNIKGYI